MDRSKKCKNIHSLHEARIKYLKVKNLKSKNVETENIVSENGEIQELASDKINVQELAADKISVQELAADKINVQELASDKINVQELASDKINVQELASDKINVQELYAEKWSGVCERETGTGYEYESVMNFKLPITAPMLNVPGFILNENGDGSVTRNFPRSPSCTRTVNNSKPKTIFQQNVVDNADHIILGNFCVQKNTQLRDTRVNGSLVVDGPVTFNGNVAGITGAPGTNCVLLKYLGTGGLKGDLVKIAYNDNDIAGVRNINCAPNWEWVVQTGGTNFDGALGISTDCNGNCYFTGAFSKTATFGSTTLTASGLTDIFVAKLDTLGNWKWAVQVGSPLNESGYKISVDCNGNCYVIGVFPNAITLGSTTLISSGNGDVFIAKLDALGNWKWAVQAGGTDFDGGYGIRVDCDGNSYVTGAFGRTATFGSTTLTASGIKDIFTAKLDTLGNWEWVVQAGGIAFDQGSGISVDCNGNCYITGDFSGTATFGSTTLTASGSSSVFVAKLDMLGTWKWAVQSSGSLRSGSGYGIIVDSDGNSYVTGSFDGTAIFGSTTLISSGSGKVFIAKLDALGNWKWAVQADGVNGDVGLDISVDCNGNSYVTGNFYGTAKFGSTTLTALGNTKVFVAKLDTMGSWKWAVQAGGINYNQGSSISVDCNGNCYITGNFDGTATFGSTTLTSSGSNDVFVAKLNGSNLGVVGLLKENATKNSMVNVCFPGGTILTDTFATTLTPGYHYYIDDNCVLSNCNKCAQRYLGIALDKTNLLTGVNNGCYK
jgi:hypothetical protein